MRRDSDQAAIDAPLVLDPTISLAFSLHTNPGAYALLLGSGISRSAEIPTGWEVVVDLIEQVAALSDADSGGNPAGWYRERFERDADYSVLLEELASEPGERQRLLRAYFEPNDDDREQGRKMPTPAHAAIARLRRPALRTARCSRSGRSSAG